MERIQIIRQICNFYVSKKLAQFPHNTCIRISLSSNCEKKNSSEGFIKIGFMIIKVNSSKIVHIHLLGDRSIFMAWGWTRINCSIAIDHNLNSKIACRAMASMLHRARARQCSSTGHGIVTNFLHRYNNSKRKRKNIFRAAGRWTYAWQIKQWYYSTSRVLRKLSGKSFLTRLSSRQSSFTYKIAGICVI